MNIFDTHDKPEDGAAGPDGAQNTQDAESGEFPRPSFRPLGERLKEIRRIRPDFSGLLRDVRRESAETGGQLLAFLKWVLIAAALGLFIGGVSVAFDYSVDFATSFRKSHDWILWLLPLGGVAIVLLYKLCGLEKDRGTDLMLMAVRSTEQVTIKIAPLIFISTFVTHFVGGSAGREGAALQLGGSIGGKFGRLLHMDDKDLRIMTMCGMSAAFSALFSTPVAAVVFSMEVVSVGVMYYAALIPCTVSAIVGFWLATVCGVDPLRFTLAALPAFDLLSLGKVLLLGALCAAVSILFCQVIHTAGRWYARLIPQPVVRAAVGGGLVLLLTFIAGSRDYNGIGMDVIRRALGGEARPEAFILKLLLTALTLGAGFKGGEIVPAFFIGATFGNVMGGLLGLDPAFGAALGMVALFCGVTNCPLTSLLLSVELFGAPGLLFFAVATAVSYMLSGYYGLYREQKILYSKIRPEFIDKKAR